MKEKQPEVNIPFKDKSGTNIISMTNNGNGTVDISFGDKFKVSGSPILDVKALANALRIVCDVPTEGN